MLIGSDPPRFAALLISLVTGRRPTTFLLTGTRHLLGQGNSAKVVFGLHHARNTFRDFHPVSEDSLTGFLHSDNDVLVVVEGTVLRVLPPPRETGPGGQYPHPALWRQRRRGLPSRRLSGRQDLRTCRVFSPSDMPIRSVDDQLKGRVQRYSLVDFGKPSHNGWNLSALREDRNECCRHDFAYDTLIVSQTRWPIGRRRHHIRCLLLLNGQIYYFDLHCSHCSLLGREYVRSQPSPGWLFREHEVSQ